MIKRINLPACNIIARERSVLVVVFASAWLAACVAFGQQTNAPQSNNPPTVGEPRTIEELFLPGSQLQPRPLTDERQPIVIRIVNAFPHGTKGYRYDLTYSAYEPGAFDLRDYLVRVDGSSTADLPAIPVQIRSLLPPGQIEPNALPKMTLPRLGGYRFWMTIAIIFWVWVLAAILFWGWRRREDRLDRNRIVSLADLLRPRIQAAMDGQLDSRQFAELERMLIAMWQRRLRLNDIEPNELASKIRQHPESGPLMRSLESWMHDPAGNRSVDLNKLLEPLSRLSASDLEKLDAGESADRAEPAAHVVKS